MKSKVLVQIFVASESFFFAALLMSYGYLGLFHTVGPASVQKLDVARTGFYSIALFVSSFTMMRTRANFLKQKFTAMKLWLSATIILGAVFIYGEGSEYIDMYSKQITMSRNTFGSGFFTITGFHGLHVTLGLIMLLTVLGLATFGDMKKFGASALEGVEVYWHFVDGVWFFVYTTIYLMPLILSFVSNH
jgi:heme/copper-type cytochrome/quinol oxidase subunit 3